MKNERDKCIFQARTDRVDIDSPAVQARKNNLLRLYQTGKFTLEEIAEKCFASVKPADDCVTHDPIDGSLTPDGRKQKAWTAWLDKCRVWCLTA